MSNVVTKAIDDVEFLLKLVPQLPAIVHAAETLIPQAKQGPTKLLLVMEAVAEIAQLVDGLDFQRIRKTIENIVAAIVRALNVVKAPAA